MASAAACASVSSTVLLTPLPFHIVFPKSDHTGSASSFSLRQFALHHPLRTLSLTNATCRNVLAAFLDLMDPRDISVSLRLQDVQIIQIPAHITSKHNIPLMPPCPRGKHGPKCRGSTDEDARGSTDFLMYKDSQGNADETFEPTRDDLPTPHDDLPTLKQLYRGYYKIACFP